MSLSIGAAPRRAPRGVPGPLVGLIERGKLGLQMTLAMLAAGLLVLAVLWQVAFPEQRTLAELVAGAAALLVAVPVLASAWESLRYPSLHGVTDRLISVALVAAWASGDLMTAAVLPIIMILGHVLEERSLLGSREAIGALTRLTETHSRRLLPGGEVEVVATAQLRVGDRIELLPGGRVPADGVVRAGEAGLDMASLTGESIPVDVAPGDAALAGSINTNGRLELEVTRLGAETTLGKIIALMRTAERAKPPVARLLERYAGHYLALVLLIAAGTWFGTGNTGATLAVLVASCPCALVLAAPATSVAAISVAARHGILIKGAAFLEQLAEVNAVVFDKTGTLTTGELSLGRVPGGGRGRSGLGAGAGGGAGGGEQPSGQPGGGAGGAGGAAAGLAACAGDRRLRGDGRGGGPDGGAGAAGFVSAAWASRPLPRRCMTGRLRAWGMTGRSRAGCCSMTGRGRSRGMRCGSCTGWGWRGRCC